MDKVTRNIMVGTIVVLGGLILMPQRNICFPMGGTDNRIKADLKSLETVIRMYEAETGSLPMSLQQLMEIDPPLLESVPTDPWGEPYFFATAADGDSVTLATWGRDGEPGGQGDGADRVRLVLANP